MVELGVKFVVEIDDGRGGYIAQEEGFDTIGEALDRGRKWARHVPWRVVRVETLVMVKVGPVEVPHG